MVGGSRGTQAEPMNSQEEHLTQKLLTERLQLRSETGTLLM